MGSGRSPKRRVRDDDFILGYPRISSDIVGYRRIILESSFYWRKHFREFPMKSWASSFRGRRSIWWGWRVTLLGPRIGNAVSYVTQIIDDIHFAWQAQYLVRLEGGFTWSAHWKWGFMCDADHWWHSCCVAGAVFGEVGGWLHLLHALEYFVRLEGDFSCSTHWKWGFICDADHWWHSFCVAGAVFGEVGGWLHLLHALEMTFHMWCGWSMTLILCGRRSIWWGWRVTFRDRRSTSWHFGR